MQDKTPAPEQDLEYSAETSSGMGEESMGDAEGEGLSWGVATPLQSLRYSSALDGEAAQRPVRSTPLWEFGLDSGMQMSLGGIIT